MRRTSLPSARPCRAVSV